MVDDVHGHEQDDDAIENERITSPMQPYTTSQVAIGLIVLLVGLAVTVGLPLLLT